MPLGGPVPGWVAVVLGTPLPGRPGWFRRRVAAVLGRSAWRGPRGGLGSPRGWCWGERAPPGLLPVWHGWGCGGAWVRVPPGRGLVRLAGVTGLLMRNGARFALGAFALGRPRVGRGRAGPVRACSGATGARPAPGVKPGTGDNKNPRSSRKGSNGYDRKIVGATAFPARRSSLGGRGPEGQPREEAKRDAAMTVTRP
jgi:hypothetical protein